MLVLYGDKLIKQPVKVPVENADSDLKKVS
jgi:hypothetical protein